MDKTWPLAEPMLRSSDGVTTEARLADVILVAGESEACVVSEATARETDLLQDPHNALEQCGRLFGLRGQDGRHAGWSH